MTINIQSVQFKADQKLLDLVDKKVRKLNTFFDKIISVDVYMKLDEKSSTVKDKKVSIKCHIPGSSLFAEDISKTFEEGIDETVDSVRRQLKKHKAKLREN